MMQTAPDRVSETALHRPRLGFLGVGWIGHHRMKAILETGAAEIAAIVDPSPEMIRRAAELAPDAVCGGTFDELLEAGLDGVVIATPTALHAAQAIRALERGLAVFCQKPLGRTATEVRAVLDAARRADRLLAVDFSYRFTVGMRLIRDLISRGELGRIYAIDLVFHNAYGPDKPWFYDAALSGGGCVMDLGVHLVDLALWTLDFPKVSRVSSTLFAGGERLNMVNGRVEDYASIALELETGAVARLVCSWRLQAGRDALISAAFYGTTGGAALRNVNGSFYDFIAEHYRGTQCQRIATPPDAWGGRAAADWAVRLAAGQRFDPDAEDLFIVADTLDWIYGR
ncbi:Gfo/Idh/MocA family protein [Dongia deserti]|uniref:Gfo/Idh/MocA family protein n=1 Tax=Dongia deserti TaxID=2268030 RepID=UPI000E656784|nr:Gfo/Idh/MocA family oxidoreductase [Dongia deserti]